MPQRPGEKFLKIRQQRRKEAGREIHKSYNRNRTDKDIVSLYGSTRWKAVRKLKFQQDPLCEICRAKGELVPTQVAHHIVVAKENPDLFFDMDNLQSLCTECHNRIHKSKKPDLQG